MDAVPVFFKFEKMMRAQKRKCTTAFMRLRGEGSLSAWPALTCLKPLRRMIAEGAHGGNLEKLLFFPAGSSIPCSLPQKKTRRGCSSARCSHRGEAGNRIYALSARTRMRASRPPTYKWPAGQIAGGMRIRIRSLRLAGTSCGQYPCLRRALLSARNIPILQRMRHGFSEKSIFL